jgi:hypothetical protein
MQKHFLIFYENKTVLEVSTWNLLAAGAKKRDNIRVLCSAFSEDESFIEIDLVNKLQSIVEKQRDQIRTLDTSLADIKSELDEVTATIPILQGLGDP